MVRQLRLDSYIFITKNACVSNKIEESYQSDGESDEDGGDGHESVRAPDGNPVVRRDAVVKVLHTSSTTV